MDELVEDILQALEAECILDNTYVIYTSDNGYQIGNHRIPAGKCLAYRESANLPFIVRGPRIPANAVYRIPSTYIDLAPTFLDIAGVDPEDFPEQFDGRSLLAQWHDPLVTNTDSGDLDTSRNAKEIIDLEFVSTFFFFRVSNHIRGSASISSSYCLGKVANSDYPGPILTAGLIITPFNGS